MAIPAVRRPLPAAVGTGLRTVLEHRWTWLRTGVVLQLATGLVAGPVVTLLLHAALRWAGVASLTEASLGQVVRHPGSLALLAVLAVVATSAVLLQHAAFVLLARELAAGRVPRLRDLARDGAAAVRGMLGLQLGLVALYVLVIAPVGGFALGASLVRALEVPPFIAGELQKSAWGTAVWLGAVVLLGYLNLRLLLVPTFLLTTRHSPAAAYAASWRATRGRVPGLAVGAAALWLGAAAVVAVLAAGAVALTLLSDLVWPAASPVVAGLALAVAQLVLVVWVGFVAALVAVTLLGISGCPLPPPDLAAVPPARAGAPGVVATLAVVAVVAAAAVAGVAELEESGPERTTLVIAHRGATDAAVENTIESLEAAAALGADVVELDVLQAGDGGLVVVHDTNLRRIAGTDRDVADMTTQELTSTTVRQAGHSSTIPTFDDFAARAAELGIPLLVEIKTHGREHGDLVGDVVAVLQLHDLIGTSLVQTSDRGTVAQIERRHPEVRTGWVIAFSRGRLDPGLADVVTLEQTSYTPAVLRQAHTAGVRVLLWTVNDPQRMRGFLRDGVDGLITSDPARALAERAAVDDGTGISDRLADAIWALVA